MAETVPTTEEAQPAEPARTVEKSYYECGGGRKTFFALAFIVLLPFYVSLPVMLFQRITNGLWIDTWQLLVLAI
ncbi:MAG: hypothetical protein ACR2OV_05695, partial [Hyphomicrobiaceae bacterium]